MGGYDSIQSTNDALLGQVLPRRDIGLTGEPTVEVTRDGPRTAPRQLLRTDVRVRFT
jgi:hypothetical protein